MTDEPTRPSRSDIKPIYRRVLCAKCRGEHWHKLTGPYQWTCPNCGASFKQNPWVTDDHPIIEPPDYEGDKPCQAKRVPIAKATDIAQSARAMASPIMAIHLSPNPAKPVEKPANAQLVAVQASFL